jgi:nucleotide-binding universal stress UspA family protein
MIKSILTVVEDVDKASGLVKSALAYAEYLGAHLTVQILTPGPVAMPELAPFGALYYPDDELTALSNAQVEKLRQQVSKSAAAVDVLGFHDDVAWLTGDMRKARLIADLTVLGSVETWTVPWLHRRVAETLALASGTPLLILPPGRSIARVNHAVLGWKSTAVTVRALHDLVALAEPGARIDIVSIGTPPADDHHAGPHTRVTHYLALQGFQPKSFWIDDGNDAATQLQIHALEQGADVLACGAFGHSRVREVIFGSVTEKLITETRLPVLLSH